LKKIKLLLDDLYLKNGYVLKDDKLFYSTKYEFNLPRFSLILLSARNFNKEYIKKLLNSFNQKEIYEYIFIVGNNNDKEWLIKNLDLINGKVALNPNPHDVLYTSIKIGIKAMSLKSNFIIFHFSTLSNIKGETIKYLIDSVLKSEKDIFIPIYENKRGHPIIFRINMKEVLCELRKEKGLPYILKKFQDKIEEIEVGDLGVLRWELQLGI